MVAALHDIIVMDLSQGLSGPICSMLLGDLGARVIKIEPVGGDWARELEPSQGNESAVFMALNRNKESLAVDVLTPEGREVVQRLARLADVVICDQTAKQAERAGYDYADLSALNPRLIYGLLTPFGEQGPWADHPASELVVQAASGYPRYLGTYGEAPVRIGADVASTMGGVFLLQGLLAALWYRQRYGSGQGVAVSQLGALFAIKTIQITAQYNPDAWEGYHCWGPYDAPDTGWQTKDRPLVFSFGEFTGGGPDKQSQWPAFCHALGLEALLDDPNCDQDGKNSTGLGADAAAYRAIYEAAFQNKTAAELVALIRGLEGAAYPYHTHKTLLADEQTRAMQLLQCTPAGDYCAIKMPWNFSDMPAVRLVAPPTLGNATGKVLAELGYDTEQRTHLYHAGIVAGTDMGTSDAIAPLSIPVDASLVSEPAVSAPASIQYRGGPLDGIRVMDISGMGVGPVTGRFLAELGAEVIKVEPPHGDLALTVPPTQGGTSVLYLAANLCKRGIFLNLKDPHDLDRAYRLAEQSDVFIENFRVGVVDRLGLGYEALAARNPRLIYCSLSGFGPHGPLAKLPSIDTYIQAFSGFASLNGAPGSRGESLRNIGFIDLSTSAITVPAILAALIYREHIGRGQLIVASMLEAASTLQTSRIAEYLATGECAPPHGSGMPYSMPDQAFAVRDGYLAVSARTQTEWEALCRALERQDLLHDPRYQTLADRLTHRKALVAQLADTLRVYPSAWWIKRLTQAGVPCGGFHAYNDMSQHAQVQSNGLMTELPTSHWGTLRVAGLPWMFSLTPGVQHPGPLPGGDTVEVLAELLGEIA